MKKKNRRSLWRTVLLFAVAVGLLTLGSVGTSRAVALITSEYYSGGVELYDIGITLVENGTAVSKRSYAPNSRYIWDESFGALLSNLLGEGESFHMGQTYPEVLTVTNSGTIDEFVRVSIYKYWVDASGRKLTTLAPDTIDLKLVTGGDWVIDDAASSSERTVLYYTSVLPAGETTTPFTETLTVDAELPFKAHQTYADGVYTTTYDYQGVTFQIDVQADAVQTHNAEPAVRSAWGRNVSVSGNSLQLG